MDVLKFVKSKDERDYLTKIGYEFNACEAAYLVSRDNEMTYKDRHAAWQEIIDTMPDVCDCTQHRPEHCDAYKSSVHKFLLDYMNAQNKVLNDLVNDQDDAIYLCGSYWDFRLYRSFEDALRYVSLSPIEEKRITIQKRFFDSDIILYAFYNRKAELLGVLYHNWIGYIGDEYDLIPSFTSNIHASLPHPFEPGDIICHISDKTPQIFTGQTDKNLFVVEDCDRHKASLCDLYDYEYYRHKPRGKYRALIPYSNYLKGKIDRDLFEKSYYQIIREEEVLKGRRDFYKCGFNSSVREMLGLSVEKYSDFYYYSKD